jgi:hypothetical protein
MYGIVLVLWCCVGSDGQVGSSVSVRSFVLVGSVRSVSYGTIFGCRMKKKNENIIAPDVQHF